MAIIRVKSGAAGSANGTSWTDAYTTIAAADATDAAGDTIVLSQSHSESTNANVTLSLAGTVASPTKIICANDSSDPPTAESSGAVIATGAGAYAISVGGVIFAKGVTFRSGVGSTSSTATITLANVGTTPVQRYESCNFELASTGSAYVSTSLDGPTVPHSMEWKSCGVKFAAVGQRIHLNGRFRWSGGSVLSGTTSPTALFHAKAAGGFYRPLDVMIENVDFSNLSNTFGLIEGTPVSSGIIKLRNCKMPSGWNPSSLFSASITGRPGVRAELENVDAGDTNYRLYHEDAAGKIRTEVTIVRTGGANDGTTAFAWKMESSSTASFPLIRLESPQTPARWNSTVGGSVTATIDILHDSLTNLKDDEVWLEVQYLGTSGFPLGVSSSDAKSDTLTTGVDQTTSSETWTTTGMTNPNKQKLSVTFTPQEAGYIQAKVVVTKASYTIYVDPKLQVS